MTRNKPITFLASAAALAATILLVAACGSASETRAAQPVPSITTAQPSSALTTWSLPGAGPQNTRNVGGPINASNVSTLGVAWTFPITAHSAFGGYATTPVVANGVLYTQDLDSNVQAVNFTSGKVIWTHKYNSPNEGPNGVTFANGNLYGTTNRAAFALDAATGKAAVDQDTGPQRQRGHRHGPGIQRRHGLRVDGARQREHLLRRQRPGCSVGDGCLDGGDQVEVRRGAREPLVLSAQEHQLGRRHVESADVR